MNIAALSSSALMSMPNRFKYNAGTELNGDFGINWYETTFRGFDAQLGRFMQIDPLADILTSITPYNYGFNNPVYFNDPTGLIGEKGSQSLATCPTCPDDKKYDPYKDSLDPYIYDPSISPIPFLDGGTVVGRREPEVKSNLDEKLKALTIFIKNGHHGGVGGTPQVRRKRNSGGRWFNGFESETSQPFGYNFYVTDGSGGVGSNVNGFLLGTIDLTEFISLISSAAKSKNYEASGKFAWTDMVEGASSAEQFVNKIIEQYGNDVLIEHYDILNQLFISGNEFVPIQEWKVRVPRIEERYDGTYDRTSHLFPLRMVPFLVKAPDTMFLPRTIEQRLKNK